MYKKCVFSLVFLLCVGEGLFLYAQDEGASQLSDTIPLVPNTIALESENATWMQNEFETPSVKPDPEQAIWLGAIIPGYGQILNRKYWKLPIVYAGFIGCYFAVTWNSNRFTRYRNAFLDITDNDASTQSYLKLIPEGLTMQNYGGERAFTGMLNTGMDRSRYYRDLSIIITVAYYGLTLIDAFVDAHLYDFDISTDLSLQVRPVLLKQSDTNTPSSYAYGLGARFKF